MSKLKLIIVAILLVVPALAAAEVPGTATWYLHVDFEAMRSEEAGKAIYGWMEDEVFDEVISESGVDLGKELDRLTAYSLEGQGPLFLFEGDISEESKDRVMTFIALEGDLQPRKSSGKSYYRLAGATRMMLTTGQALTAAILKFRLKHSKKSPGSAWI